MRIRFGLLFALVFMWPGGASLYAAPDPPGLEEGLFEVQAHPLAPLTTTALVNGRGGVLLPLGPVVRMLEIPMTVSDDGARIMLLRPSGDHAAVLRARESTVSVGGELVRVASDELAIQNGEIFLATERLAELLEATVEVDWAALRVGMARRPPFPAQQRLAAEVRAVALQRALPESATDLRAIRYRSLSGGSVLDWSVSSAGSDQFSAHSRVGVAVLGGQLMMGLDSHHALGNPGNDAWSASYRRVFPEGTYLQEFEVGDLSAGSHSFPSLRGFRVSNAPVVSRSAFQSVLLTPHVPPGWDYEVYRNSELVGYSEGPGFAGVKVPLQYGSNPFTVTMRSPAGETRSELVTFYVPADQLPTGRLEYAAGGGVCPSPGCDRAAFAGLRYGVARWLTLGGGAEYLSDSVRTDLRPTASASLVPAAGWFADVRARGAGDMQGAVRYAGEGGATGWLSAGITPLPERPGGAGGRWRVESAASFRDGALPYLRALHLGATVSGASGSGTERWNLAALTPVGGGYLQGRIEHGNTGLGVAAGGIVPVPSAAPSWLRSSGISGEIGFSAGTVDRVEVSTTVQPRKGSIALGGGWQRGHGSPTVSIGYSTDLGFSRLRSRLNTAPNGSIQSNFALDGSLTYNRRLGLSSADRQSVGMAGIAGVVFLDTDGDGKRGAQEEPLADVPVRVDGRSVVSSADGSFHRWLLNAYAVTSVVVDTLRLAEIGLAPLQREILLRPVPNLYNPVEIALVRTREVSGHLVAGPGIPTAGGITIEITNLASKEVQRAVTFSDGEYYVSRLRAGEYELRIAESSLRALEAQPSPEPARILVPAVGNDPITAPPIRLDRKVSTPELRAALSPAA